MQSIPFIRVPEEVLPGGKVGFALGLGELQLIEVLAERGVLPCPGDGSEGRENVEVSLIVVDVVLVVCHLPIKGVLVIVKVVPHLVLPLLQSFKQAGDSVRVLLVPKPGEGRRAVVGMLFQIPFPLPCRLLGGAVGKDAHVVEAQGKVVADEVVLPAVLLVVQDGSGKLFLGEEDVVRRADVPLLQLFPGPAGMVEGVVIAVAEMGSLPGEHQGGIAEGVSEVCEVEKEAVLYGDGLQADGLGLLHRQGFDVMDVHGDAPFILFCVLLWVGFEIC